MKTNFKQLKNNFKQTVLKLALVFAFVLGIAGLGVNAYAATTTQGVTSATVLIPIAVENTTTLAFGKFTNVAQSITVDPAGERTSTGTSSLLITGPTSAHAAGAVTVTGDANASYSITLTPATLIGPVGSTAMVLSFMKAAASTATGTLITVGTVGAGGTQILNIGATLAVGAAQVAGAYAGAYTVEVQYN